MCRIEGSWATLPHWIILQLAPRFYRMAGTEQIESRFYWQPHIAVACWSSSHSVRAIIYIFFYVSHVVAGEEDLAHRARFPPKVTVATVSWQVTSLLCVGDVKLSAISHLHLGAPVVLVFRCSLWNSHPLASQGQPRAVPRVVRLCYLPYLATVTIWSGCA